MVCFLSGLWFPARGGCRYGPTAAARPPLLVKAGTGRGGANAGGDFLREGREMRHQQKCRGARTGAGLCGGSPFSFAPLAYGTRATLAQAERFTPETTRSIPRFNLGQIRAKFPLPVRPGGGKILAAGPAHAAFAASL